MTALCAREIVFGLELLVNNIEYLTIDTFPSLILVMWDLPPFTLVPYSFAASPGKIQEVNKIYQLMYVADAFEKCVSSPLSFELISPFESLALGKCTFELHPLICDSIAAQGSSPVAGQVAILRDYDGGDVARVKFELRVVAFNIGKKRAAIERFRIREIKRSEGARIFGQQAVAAGEMQILTPEGEVASSDVPTSPRGDSSQENLARTAGASELRGPGLGGQAPAAAAELPRLRGSQFRT
jgi:hypothetical protein